jgi:protocatechuate 3,4-dioxygenase beta subunit
MTRHVVTLVLGSLALAAPPAVAQAVTGSPRPGEVIQQPAPGTPPRDTSGRSAPATGTAVIRGVVTDADTGQPIRRATVMAGGRAQRVEPRATSTDDEGRFEFREMVAGEYSISVRKPGYASLGYGQRRWNEPSRPVTLRDGEVFDKANVALHRGGVVTGRVVDEVGEPVLEAQVRVMRQTWVRGKRRMMTAGGNQTNDLGIYRVFGLPPGEYFVSAMTRGGMRGFARDDTPVEYAPTYYPGVPDAATARPVTVTASQETLADFSLAPTRVTRISGMVLSSLGKPVTEGNVRAIQRNDAEMGFVADGAGGMIRQDGTFVINGLTPGTWTLLAMGAGVFGPGDEREVAQQAVTVGDEDLAGVVLTMGKGGSVRGRVSFEGVPPQDVSNVRVGTRPIDELSGPIMGGSRPAPLGTDGAFEVSGLTGTVTFMVMGAPSGWFIKSVQSGGRDVYDTGIDVPAGRSYGGVTIVMTQDRITISGSVTDDRGTPVKDYQVIAFAEDREKWYLPSGRYMRLGRPDQDGLFKLEYLAPSKYLIVALADLDTSTLGDPDEMDRLREVATEVTLTDRETKTVQLKLAR